MEVREEQRLRVRNGRGFFAALDQSGGSTPKTLRRYGIPESDYSGEEEMFAKVHEMRARIMADKAFGGDRIIAAILFEGTMDRDVQGQRAPTYLWQRKRIVPFVKVDKGLDKLVGGARLMKPIPDLDEMLERAREAGVYGTKMRSVIVEANAASIERIVEQQFELARRIFRAGLTPIVEPEISIDSPNKPDAERMLRASLIDHLDRLVEREKVIFKLTLPEVPNYYAGFTRHRRVERVVALSGGYSRSEANSRLEQNHDVIASFSRALTEDLRHAQSDEEFSATLKDTVESIYQASVT